MSIDIELGVSTSVPRDMVNDLVKETEKSAQHVTC